MTQHIELDYQDEVHEGFFDAIQELLGAAVPSLNITVLNATTLQIDAGAGNEQQSVTIGGAYRWRTGDTTAGLPGGLSDGTHPVFVTASANNFTGSVGDPDAPTDYTFGLTILATGTTPGTALYRQVGEVQVASGAITSFRQTAGPRAREGNSFFARAEHPTQNALRVRAAASQSADIVRVEDSSGAALLTINAAGVLTSPGGIVENSAAGLTLSGNGGKTTLALTNTAANVGLTIGGDANLYRLSAGVLSTDGSLNIGGSINHGGTFVNLQNTGVINWGADTNLYRSAANILKTDDTFSAQALQVAGAALNSTHLSDSANLVRINGTHSGYIDMTSYRVSGSALASTHLADTANLARLNAANVFTGALQANASGVGLAVADDMTVGDLLTVGRLVSGAATLNGDLTMNSNRITGLPTPGGASDPVRNDDSRLTNERVPTNNSVSTAKLQNGAVTAGKYVISQASAHITNSGIIANTFGVNIIGLTVTAGATYLVTFFGYVDGASQVIVRLYDGVASPSLARIGLVESGGFVYPWVANSSTLNIQGYGWGGGSSMENCTATALRIA